MSDGKNKKFYTYDELKEHAEKLGLKPNTVLWYTDPDDDSKSVTEDLNIYRGGDKPKYKEDNENAIETNRPRMYLTWADIDKQSPDGERSIKKEYWSTEVVKPGQGISTFLQPNLDQGYQLIKHINPDEVPARITGSVDKQAKSEGYSPRVQRHFYELHINGRLPPSLQIVYDGGIDKNPPGHCTLTVTSETTVARFHELVNQFVAPKMVYIGPALIGQKRHR